MTPGGGEGFRLLGLTLPPGRAAGPAGHSELPEADKGPEGHNGPERPEGPEGHDGREHPEGHERESVRPQLASSASHPATLVAKASFLIPSSSPLFDGHFPGKPIFPGVAHLALVRRVLTELAARGLAANAAGSGEPPRTAEVAGNGAAPEAVGAIGDTMNAGGAEGTEATEIVAVRNLRLRLPVNPGDRLALRLAANTGGSLRFEIRRGAELVSQGEVRTAGPNTAPSPSSPTPPLRAANLSSSTPADATATGPENPFPPTAALLPHAPPARLLSAVLSASATSIVCSAVIPVSHPLAAGAAAPGFLGLEIAAQAAACLEALRRSPTGAPPIGYLVGVRHADLAPTLPCGVHLHVSANLAGHAAALTVYEFELHLAAESATPYVSAAKPLAAGTLSTFLPTTG